MRRKTIPAAALCLAAAAGLTVGAPAALADEPARAASEAPGAAARADVSDGAEEVPAPATARLVELNVHLLVDGGATTPTPERSVR